jgi:bleomycin hydrolase
MKLLTSLFTATLAFSLLCAKAQQPANGSISPAMLKQMQSSVKNDASTIALRNAITNAKINDLAVNHKAEGEIDHLFSVMVKTKGITNQKSSGRCWLFTALNVFRPMVTEKYKLETFEFSQTYPFFYDQLEKANLFLEGIIATTGKPLDDRLVEWLLKNPIGDGGQWTTFADIVQKYGVVPASIMPETSNSENTVMMSKLLTQKLREDALELRQGNKMGRVVTIESLRKRKAEMLGEIYRMLTLYLGEPPAEFSWRYKDKDGKISEAMQFTPKSFFEQAVGVNLADYIMFMNDPSRDYYNLYEIEYDRNMVDGYNWKYINLPAAELKPMAVASLQGNEALYFGCDVGKQLNSTMGTLDLGNYDYESLVGVTFKMDKKQRIQTFESGSSHGMALVGVDLDTAGKPTQWMLENSWGADSGHNGYLTMTDSWFEEYMFRLVVNKKYVPEATQKIAGQKPVMLPPWDPMFAPEL